MKKSSLISPSKTDRQNTSTKTTDENKSPQKKNMQSNNLMMSWLNKSASKSTAKSSEKSTSNEKTASSASTSVCVANVEAPKPLTNKQENSSSQYFDKNTKREDVVKPSNKVSKKGEKISPKDEFKKKARKVVEDNDDDEDEDDDFLKKKKPSKSSKAKTTPPKSAKAAASVEKTSKSTPTVIHKTIELDEKANKSTTTASGGTKKPANKFYAAYMRREGPKNPGSKPIPIGKKDCFGGLKFLITGVLESMDREECKTIVEKYGGSLVSGVTKKLDYLIVGDDAGVSKLEKATELKIKKLNEDEFLQLICTKSGIKEPKYESREDEAMIEDDEEEEKKEEEVKEKEKVKTPKKEKSTTPQKRKNEIEYEDEVVKVEPKKVKTTKTPPKSPMKSSIKSPSKQVESKVEKKEETAVLKQISNIKIASQASTQSSTQSQSNSSELWVEKYKPKLMTKIIGQGTEKSNANKLLNWLKNWNKWHSSTDGSKAAKKSWNDQDTGSSFKCALLSGPPGIGKTTTAELTCKEAGYTFIALNASDSRSKKLLDSVLGESVESASIDSYLKGKHKVEDLSKDKHCIIMDEVDGMAGNEDRGGIQQLIAIVKSAKIPIICICNDRQHVKIRSLANYCFDLRFYKPRLEQIRAALMSICFKEGIKITPDLLDQIITGCNYDIRQCMHNLSMWSSNNKNMVASKSATADIEKAMKDVKMNPFEACKQVFQGDVAGKPHRSFNDKLDLFFTDYSLMPLLIQENYVNLHPTNLKDGPKSQRDRQHLSLLAETADSLIECDRVGKLLRTNNNWSLLPTQAVFATLVPGEKLNGSMGLPAFPSWFGKNSKQGRVDRILQELQKHMRIHISANKIGVGMDYLSVLKQMLTKPLIKNGAEGIPKVIALMNEYSLTRDDFDTIIELATWPNQKDLMSAIDSKVKAAFTRAYNKESHMNPFSIVNVKKLKGVKLSEEGDELEGEEEEEDHEKDDDVTADAMIKVKKVATKSAAASSKSTAVKRGAARTNDEVEKPKSKKTKT